MLRSVALGACLARVAAGAPCPWPNTIGGQNQFQVAAQSYQDRKNAAITVAQEECNVARTQFEEAKDCTYNWITPWLTTVWSDVTTYCGTSSSGSAESWFSLSSGSQGSMPSSYSSVTSSASGQLTNQQKVWFFLLFLLACCCCCGSIAVLYLARTGKFGAKKTKPRDDYYDDETPYGDYGDYEQQQYDYEQQQYDQGYPAGGGAGDAPPALAPGEIPMAAMGVDTTGDGMANYTYVGADMNRDGIPDALQGGMQMPPVPQASFRR